MSLKPFRIPETRLLAINDLVVQVTLTFRTSDDEELRHRYEQNPTMQSLVLTTLVSLVNCNYTNGMGKGPGFLLHQMRKKWPIGRRYIFTRNGEPMHSSMHKFFFQLELTDPEEGAMLEIAEIRAVGMSPAASSYAGSVIEGLDAVSLPPVENMFSAEEFISGGRGRRSSSVYSGYSATNRSPVIRPTGPPSPRYGPRGGTANSTGITPEIRRASISDNHATMGYRAAPPSVSMSQQAQFHAPRYNPTRPPAVSEEPSPVMPSSSIRTRSISRSSVGSARTMHSVGADNSLSPRISQKQAYLPPQHPSNINNPPVSASTTANASTSVSPGDGRLRLGRTNWYRSLHGISPLSRQPKSLSSSDNEFINGAPNNLAAAAADIAVINNSGSNLHTTGSRIAGQLPPPSRIPKPTISKRAAVSSDNEHEDTGEKASFASRLKRRVMTPLGIHNRTKQQQQQRNERESAIPRPSSAVSSNINTSQIVSRPDMPPPSSTRPLSRMASKPRSDSVSIPTAVKNALMRRLRSPLSSHPDRSGSRLSVRDRIAAFNTLSVRSTPERDMSPGPNAAVDNQSDQQQQIQQREQQVVVDRPIAVPRSYRIVSDNPEPEYLSEEAPGTPSGRGKRTRLATATGFISMGSPAKSASAATQHHIFRSESPASNSGIFRAESPAALSAVSNVSVRVQDTIHALERAANNATPSRKPDTVLEMLKSGGGTSGVKRVSANDMFDEFASPSKRPRAPSMAAQSTPAQTEEEKASSLLNPFSVVQRMVRRHTRR
ncbi:hypothetical protein J3B02_000779 [Coemansia erecta]|uniref:Uncharacterized protein n=1 Tax=Coemansia asiatica TaxID=1052880 RepID=A0A9W8CHS2_9FUNG|nr:hypothetical protein LPJ64_004538 [Coemansia asiatica]KAJ2857748.1 hypothetical protein J3B02_000779 [Coemansia erecta]